MMADYLLNLDPVLPFPIVFIVALASLMFFVIMEFRRQQRFLFLRIVAISLVLVSLLGIVLQPFYWLEQNPEPIILLTKDYLKSKVDSIVQANSRLKIIRTKDASPYSGSSILKSWYALSYENIFCVVGQGIPEYALAILHNKEFQFIPAAISQGITKLIIPKDICSNERRQITGTFNSAEKAKLKLVGPGGAIDSVLLDRGASFFSLSFTPKQSGNFIYSLVFESSSRSPSSARIPLEVLPEKQLRIIFLQKFPSAEVRFLKNFLSEKHHQIAVRYQISKSNFIYDFSNLPEERIDNLSSDLLKSFDLLFLDQQSYNELSALEKNDLKESVNNGLGVIFLLHDVKDKALSELLPVKSKISANDTVHVRLSSSRLNVLPILPIELDNDPSIVPITKNRNRILSGYYCSGRGKIGFQFIEETFRMGIEGNFDDYSALWTPLIVNAGRAKELNFKLKLLTPFPIYNNETLDIIAISSGPHPSIYADSVIVPIKENTLVDDYWTGQSWAGKSGWHQLNIKQDSTQLNYFVSDTSEWKALRVSNQIKANQLHRNSRIIKAEKISHPIPVPKLIFYFIFLFSSAFLWLAPKI